MISDYCSRHSYQQYATVNHSFLEYIFFLAFFVRTFIACFLEVMTRLQTGKLCILRSQTLSGE